jgi:hypothetical protein
LKGGRGEQISASVRCSAEELKYLWAFRGAIENVMMHKCKHIASSFMDYCVQHLQDSPAAPSSVVCPPLRPVVSLASLCPLRLSKALQCALPVLLLAGSQLHPAGQHSLLIAG